MGHDRVTSLLGALVLALAAAPAGAAPTSRDSGGPTTQIIGGGHVSSAPWAAALYYSDGFYCSGTIIAPRWVMTARHCIYEGHAMSVRVGNVHHPSGTYANVRRVVQARGADLALLNLDRTVNTTYAAIAGADPRPNTTNNIYGWGTTEPGENAPLSDRLKTATVRVTSANGTDYFGGRAIRSRVQSGGPGYGDSGGPQLAGGRLVGVCSTGDYTYQQYTSVNAYRGWIRDTAGI